jgi:23S rRNA (guanine745-N1)-methyltransferase
MPQLLCTVRTCGEPLQRETVRVICPRGHAFDIARSGYINLLQPQDRRAAIPGDHPEAVAARRRFLDRGYAQPLLDGIRALIDGEAILDAGCGEGYYLGTIGRGCGVDISTAAIDLAAKRYPQCEWIVANADRFVPYADESFDTIMSITGRMNADEFHRVLKPEGSLVIAVASPDDLVELRGRGNRDRVERTIATFASRFRFVDQRRVSARVELDETAARDVLAATYRPRAESPRTTHTTLSLDVLRFVPAAT